MKRRFTTLVLCTLVVLASTMLPFRRSLAAPPAQVQVSAWVLRLLTLNAACASSTGVNLYQASEVNDLPEFWTFTLNFRVGTAGQWLGCLQFYFRDPAKGTNEVFVGNLFTAVLVPCYTAGGNVIKRTLGTSRYAHFDGGYIRCDLDLKQRLKELVEVPDFYKMMSNHLGFSYRVAATIKTHATSSQGFAQDNNLHTYPYFAAVIGLGSAELAANSPNPLVYYLPPQESTKISEDAGGFAFWLPSDDHSNFSYEVFLQSQKFSPNQGACDFNPIVNENATTYVQVDFGQPGNQKTPVQFCQGSNSSSPCEPTIQDVCEPKDISPAVSLAKMPFNVGSSTLYIGYDPASKETFKGDMYEVFIDPDSASKR